jgi:hypothetical protein
MRPDRQQDVVDKQWVSLVGMPEGGQQQPPEAANHEVVNAHAGLLAQIANSRRVGVVRDRVQRHTLCMFRKCLMDAIQQIAS